MTTNSSPATLRLFFALWPDANTRAALLRLQVMRGRLVPFENLHITLAFLGQQPPETVPVLKEILAHLPATELTLTFDRLSYFNRNRIAWAGMHHVPEELLKLQQTLADALALHGISFDNGKDFKPHITLARDAEPPMDLAFTPILWHADQVALVQSKTGPHGSQYQVIATRSLTRAERTPDERGPAAVPAAPDEG